MNALRHAWGGRALRAVGLGVLLTNAPDAASERPASEPPEPTDCPDASDPGFEGVQLVIEPDEWVYEQGGRIEFEVAIVNASNRAVLLRDSWSRANLVDHVCAFDEEGLPLARRDDGVVGGSRRIHQKHEFTTLPPQRWAFEPTTDAGEWFDFAPGTYRVFFAQYVGVRAPGENARGEPSSTGRVRSNEVEITIIPRTSPP